METEEVRTGEEAYLSEIFSKLAEGEEDIRQHRVVDAFASLKKLREKYGISIRTANSPKKSPEADFPYHY